MQGHVKPGETRDWITFIARRVGQRNAKVIRHSGFHGRSHITDTLRRWLHKLSGSVANSRDRQPGFLPTADLAISDGSRRLGGVGQHILTSAESGANRPLWRSALPDLGVEFWAEFRKKVGKNVVRTFSVRAMQHLDRQIRKLAVRIQPGNLRVAPGGCFSKVDIREHWTRKANARRAAGYIVKDRNANQYGGQFHGRVRRLFHLFLGNRRIAAAEISSGYRKNTVGTLASSRREIANLSVRVRLVVFVSPQHVQRLRHDRSGGDQHHLGLGKAVRG